MLVAAQSRTDTVRAFPQSDRLVYVDGVRAIAIIAVVAFHAHIPGFSGGFVGVDVFFVISGFLITRLIVSQMLAGRFSAYDFYARRILRILPPLLLVTLVTLAVAPLFPLLPPERHSLAASAAATAAMISNYYFSAGFNYFAPKAALSPLLHTWSLGVEEQYYLLAPAAIMALLAWAAARKLPPAKALLWLGAVIFALSYLTLAVLTKSDHRLAFFSIMTRSWQFGLGGMLAVLALNGSPLVQPLRTPLAAAGLLAIAAAVFLYDDHMSYPGVAAALLPTFGALFVLAAGIDNSGALPIRLLSSRPAVAIGILSYSWYLWHWPLTELARTLPLGEDTLWKDAAASLVALVLSAPTYALVERPMKRLRHDGFTRRFGRQIVIAGVLVSALIAVFALVLSRSAGFVGSAPALDKGTVEVPLTGCRAQPGLPAFRHVTPCVVGTGAPSVAFWGDSHALMLVPVAEWSARKAGRAAVVLGKTSCPPLLGVDVAFFVTRTCATSNDELLRWLKTETRGPIGGLVLAARWSLYSGHPPPSGDPELPRLLWSDSSRPSAGYAAMLARGLHDMLAAVSPRRVLILAPVPEFKRPIPECLQRTMLDGAPRETCAIDRATVEVRRKEALTALEAVVRQFPNARLIDPLAVFCDKSHCWPYGPHAIYYLDTDHLSAPGAEKLYRHFAEDFAWVYGSAAAQ